MSNNNVERTRKRKATRSGLKRLMELDHVTVQETFQFATDTSNKNDETIGHGAYITAVVHNKRYYGAIMDQATLQVVAQQQMQDEHDSLALNERMKQAQTTTIMTTTTTTTTTTDYDDTMSLKPIQKFRYKDGLRYLLATYTNAAALDVHREEIVAVCNRGGGMVGPFYYHYEVRVCSLFVCVCVCWLGWLFCTFFLIRIMYLHMLHLLILVHRHLH
jgi:hypothetical protein